MDGGRFDCQTPALPLPEDCYYIASSESSFRRRRQVDEEDYEYTCNKTKTVTEDTSAEYIVGIILDGLLLYQDFRKTPENSTLAKYATIEVYEVGNPNFTRLADYEHTPGDALDIMVSEWLAQT